MSTKNPAIGHPDARALIRSSLPFVLHHMTAAQVQQVQRVLDAYVVNPAVQKEVDDLYRKSVIAQSGPVINRDPAMVHRAKLAEGKYIRVTDADKHVRLDFQKLLAPEALRPKTDNPDEARYLVEVKRALASQGVWLRFEPQWVQDPADPSRRMVDYRKFQAWLSLGSNGDRIPTANGWLTREALLGTSGISAGYYSAVHKGPVIRMFEKAINRPRIEIDAGRQRHAAIARMRRRAFPGVVEVSELVGGANYPDQKIWDEPGTIVAKANNLLVDGKFKQSSKHLLIAAIQTASAAKLLNTYIDD